MRRKEHFYSEQGANLRQPKNFSVWAKDEREDCILWNRLNLLVVSGGGQAPSDIESSMVIYLLTATQEKRSKYP